MNYGKRGEFRGSVWQSGFRIALNTSYMNSFESQAAGWVEPYGDSHCVVHLTIGPPALALVVMLFWNMGLAVALAAALVAAFSSGTPRGFAALLLFLPFIAVDVVFIRFLLCSSYRKLKARILGLLKTEAHDWCHGDISYQ